MTGKTSLTGQVRDQAGHCPLSVIFSPVVTCKNKATSASFLRHKIHSPSRFPSLFLSSLQSFPAKLGEHVTLRFALIYPANRVSFDLPRKVGKDRSGSACRVWNYWRNRKTQNPFEVCNTRSAIQQFRCNFWSAVIVTVGYFKPSVLCCLKNI